MSLTALADALAASLGGLRFRPPVAYAYNPLDYAREPHHEYLRRYGKGRKKTLFVGMNPGPWGMAQTGVPFGAAAVVRDWLGIDGPVARPANEHPKRPVLGFDTSREEVSGARLWGWARDTFDTPERFFARFFVHNYCPLLFLDANGRNLTPDKLKAADRDRLLPPCDDALRGVVRALGIERVIGVGVFAEARAKAALDGAGLMIGRVLHPSPASPAANRGWAEQATAQLRAQGIEF